MRIRNPPQAGAKGISNSVKAPTTHLEGFTRHKNQIKFFIKIPKYSNIVMHPQKKGPKFGIPTFYRVMWSPL
jgi:hypothetical protein